MEPEEIGTQGTIIPLSFTEFWNIYACIRIYIYRT